MSTHKSVYANAHITYDSYIMAGMHCTLVQKQKFQECKKTETNKIDFSQQHRGHQCHFLLTC